MYKSSGEKILKIGPHLSKLLPNIKWLTFFLGHGVFIPKVDVIALDRTAVATETSRTVSSPTGVVI